MICDQDPLRRRPGKSTGLGENDRRAVSDAATLVRRLATLWSAVAIGLVAAAGLEMRLKRDKAGRL